MGVAILGQGHQQVGVASLGEGCRQVGEGCLKIHASARSTGVCKSGSHSNDL